MANAIPDIPLEFMNPAKKYALMNWMLDLGLPQRIARGLLEQWAKSLDVELDASDYALINARLKTVPAPK